MIEPSTMAGAGADIVASAPEIAGAGLTAASASGMAWATAAIPIVGPIIAGVTLGLGFLFGRKRGRQKVAATKIVDDLEPLLQRNLDGYLNGSRTKTAQRQAVANFDAAWNYLIGPKGCGQEALGDPGHWCIDDRKAGGKWDWWKRYRSPIANDPDVKPDPTTAEKVSSTARHELEQLGIGISPAAVAGIALIGIGLVAAQ